MDWPQQPPLKHMKGQETLQKQVLCNVEILRCGQHTVFIKLKIEELLTYLVNDHMMDGIGYGFTYKEVLSIVYCFAFTNDIKHSFNSDLQVAWKGLKGF